MDEEKNHHKKSRQVDSKKPANDKAKEAKKNTNSKVKVLKQQQPGKK